MGKARRWLDQLADQADLPGEAGLPLMELAGDRRVLIEHHQGVTQYSSGCICVKVKYGLLSVEGCGLELARMSREQLIIRGRIDQVRLIRRKG